MQKSKKICSGVVVVKPYTSLAVCSYCGRPHAFQNKGKPCGVELVYINNKLTF